MIILDLFRKAAELGRLDKEAVQLRGEIDFLRDKIRLLEKEVVTQRNKTDKILLRYADQVSRQNKLPEVFVRDIEPEPKKVEVDPIESFVKNDHITHYAKELRDADIEKGMNVASLQEYIDAIAADPDSVFISGT